MNQDNNNPKNPIWIYKQGKGDFGFVDIVDEDGEKKWYYVHERNKADALDGDEVSFRIKEFRWKEEAEIRKVVKRSGKTLVWELQIPKGKKGFGFFVPNNSFLDTDIFIPGKYLWRAKHWDIVGVQVYAWDKRNPAGKIVEILGNKKTRKIDILSLAVEGGARLKFPGKVLDEVRWLRDNLGDEMKKRKDLRNTFTFTIDGADSKDLDDAISIEKIGDNYKLSVHIADVTHYVREGTPLDTEAQKRATSIYLIDKVIPMLPEKLSNDLCSLNPNEVKLTLTCEMTINPKGHVIASEVYESIIKSNYRLTYNDVEKLTTGESLEETEFWKEINKTLLSAMDDCKDLKKILTKRKQSEWVLNFDFPEPKIELDENDHPIHFWKYVRYNSHKIIEEFMVLANEAVSRQFQKKPFLYRIHEKPGVEDLSKLVNTLSAFDIDISASAVDTKTFAEILDAVQGKSSEKFLQKALLRSLSKAIYSEKALGHFWLWLSYYSHFTSPIRRYPDLQIHRIIKESLSGKLNQEKLLHYKDILPGVAVHSSERERAAENIEYKVRDLMSVKYMGDKIGQEFEASISGIIQKWLFVELDNTIEWFIEMNGSWDFNEEFMTFENYENKKKYTLWDRVQVKLESIDSSRLRINFDLV